MVIVLSSRGCLKASTLWRTTQAVLPPDPTSAARLSAGAGPGGDRLWGGDEDS
jgi:hypothetical protein